MMEGGFMRLGLLLIRFAAALTAGGAVLAHILHP